MTVELKDVITVVASVVSSMGAGAWISAVVTGRMTKRREDTSAQRSQLIVEIQKTEEAYNDAVAFIANYMEYRAISDKAEYLRQSAQILFRVTVAGNDAVYNKFYDTLDEITMRVLNCPPDAPEVGTGYYRIVAEGLNSSSELMRNHLHEMKGQLDTLNKGR